LGWWGRRGRKDESRCVKMRRESFPLRYLLLWVRNCSGREADDKVGFEPHGRTIPNSHITQFMNECMNETREAPKSMQACPPTNAGTTEKGRETSKQVKTIYVVCSLCAASFAVTQHTSTHELGCRGCTSARGKFSAVQVSLISYISCGCADLDTQFSETET
jgi:hypothetical protein